MGRSLFTSESVSEGHPDKVADQISDAVLDAMLAQDPRSRVACETLVTTGQVVVAGEITTRAQVDVQGLVRETIEEIGYTDSAYGFDSRSCGVLVALDTQSPDIAQGVNQGEGLHAAQGAGEVTGRTHELKLFPYVAVAALVGNAAGTLVAERGL